MPKKEIMTDLWVYDMNIISEKSWKKKRTMT